MLNSSFYVNYYDEENSILKNIQALTGLIGIMANTLAIFVFERNGLKKYSYSIYWKLKAYFDILLLLHTFRHMTRYFLKADIDLISPLFCRFNDYQPYVAATISNFLEGLITLDRLFTIVYPNRFKIIKQKRFQITAISLIVIYSLLVCISLPLNYRLDEISGTWICHISREKLKIVWLICLLNVYIVNILINPIIDFKIISHLIKSRRNVPNRNRLNHIELKFGLSAIGLNMTSLLFKVTFLIGNLLAMFFNIRHSEMIFSICFSILLLSYSDMFFVNFIVNSIFRREFLLFFSTHRN